MAYLIFSAFMSFLSYDGLSDCNPPQTREPWEAQKWPTSKTIRHSFIFRPTTAGRRRAETTAARAKAIRRRRLQTKNAENFQPRGRRFPPLPGRRCDNRRPLHVRLDRRRAQSGRLVRSRAPRLTPPAFFALR